MDGSGGCGGRCKEGRKGGEVTERVVGAVT